MIVFFARMAFTKSTDLYIARTRHFLVGQPDSTSAKGYTYLGDTPSATLRQALLDSATKVGSKTTTPMRIQIDPPQLCGYSETKQTRSTPIPDHAFAGIHPDCRLEDPILSCEEARPVQFPDRAHMHSPFRAITPAPSAQCAWREFDMIGVLVPDAANFGAQAKAIDTLDILRDHDYKKLLVLCYDVFTEKKLETLLGSDLVARTADRDWAINVMQTERGPLAALPTAFHAGFWMPMIISPWDDADRTLSFPAGLYTSVMLQLNAPGWPLGGVGIHNLWTRTGTVSPIEPDYRFDAHTPPPTSPPDDLLSQTLHQAVSQNQWHFLPIYGAHTYGCDAATGIDPKLLMTRTREGLGTSILSRPVILLWIKPDYRSEHSHDAYLSRAQDAVIIKALANAQPGSVLELVTGPLPRTQFLWLMANSTFWAGFEGQATGDFLLANGKGAMQIGRYWCPQSLRFAPQTDKHLMEIHRAAVEALCVNEVANPIHALRRFFEAQDRQEFADYAHTMSQNFRSLPHIVPSMLTQIPHDAGSMQALKRDVETQMDQLFAKFPTDQKSWDDIEVCAIRLAAFCGALPDDKQLGICTRVAEWLNHLDKASCPEPEILSRICEVFSISTS